MITYLQIMVYCTLLFYILSAGCYLFSSKNKSLSSVASFLALIGFITNILALLLRGIMVGRLPVSNGAEFMLWFSSFTVLSYLFYELKSKNKSAGVPVMLIAAFLVGSIFFLMANQLGDLRPLMPALKSPWLTSHVITAVFAYGGFALAAGLAAVKLKKKDYDREDDWIYRIIAGSFVMLTLTIVLGAIWAEQVWGRYWNWDPKETWALVTWIVYAIYLHLHRRKYWRGPKASLLAVIGFIFVLFTYFGVNYILSGLHSYG